MLGKDEAWGQLELLLDNHVLVSSDPVAREKEVRRLRDFLADNLLSPTFLASFAVRVLAQMEREDPLDLHPEPIFQSANTGCQVQVFTWPAGVSNCAHFHDTWNLTGVLRGEFQENVFDIASLRHQRLSIKTSVREVPGAVGAVLEPTVHEVVYLGEDVGVTLHVFSPPSDGDFSELLSNLALLSRQRPEVLLTPERWRSLRRQAMRELMGI